MPTDDWSTVPAREPEKNAPVPPQVAKEMTVKQQREARRAEKVAALKRQQQREKRNRIIGIASAAVAALAVVALVITFVVTSGQPERDPDDIEIAGLETWDDLSAVHVDGSAVDYAAEYGMTPPAGGDHWSAWLNCGVYDQPQQNENAVHSLEHGAVWFTYDPDQVSDDDLNELRGQLPDTFVLVTPYPGLDAPIVASAWGAQVALDGADDERISDFLERYWRSADAPEAGASCTGALDGPGKIA